MKVGKRFTIAIITLFCAWSAQSAFAQHTSAPISSDKINLPEYANTGLLVSDFSTGSGAVVKHPNIVLSCAHVIFNEYNFNNPWIAENLWYNRWNSGEFPDFNIGKPLRGALYFSNYSTNAFALGLADLRTFSLDFTAHFSYEALADGRFSNAWNDGASAALSQNQKLINGYPAGLYPLGHKDAFMMHQTGPFNAPFEKVFDSYYEVLGYSTGPGNSGGPLWVYQGDQVLYAGVLIAGLEKSTGGDVELAGVRMMDKKSWDLVGQAIQKLTEKSVVLPTPVQLASTPSLKIYGNTGLINDGDLSPSRADHTFLGSSTSDIKWLTRTFVLRNEGASPLQLSNRPIKINGKNRSVFKVTKPSKASLGSLESLPFRVRFRSKSPGTYKALLSVQSNDPERSPYSFLVSAVRN